MSKVSENEVSQTDLGPLHEADRAHIKALRNFGEVAASQALMLDASGNLLTPKEQEREIKFKATHGHPSNEVLTGH